VILNLKLLPFSDRSKQIVTFIIDPCAVILSVFPYFSY
jgi:hypothetical protein